MLNELFLKIFIDLILKNSSWMSNCGDSMYSSYNGRPILLASKTLSSFENYMNNINLHFSYDEAVLLVE